MRSASFLVHQLVLLLLRVVTVEVGHIHVLLPTLEYSMPVSSPAAPGLTSPRALRSRVMQALSASGIHGLGLKSRVVFRVLFWLHRGYEVL